MPNRIIEWYVLDETRHNARPPSRRGAVCRRQETDPVAARLAMRCPRPRAESAMKRGACVDNNPGSFVEVTPERDLRDWTFRGGACDLYRPALIGNPAYRQVFVTVRAIGAALNVSARKHRIGHCDSFGSLACACTTRSVPHTHVACSNMRFSSPKIVFHSQAVADDGCPRSYRS